MHITGNNERRQDKQNNTQTTDIDFQVTQATTSARLN